MALINEHSLKELKPEDVFVFSAILCDNEIDRDNEAFTASSLVELAALFMGKTGIFNHSWKAENQTARAFRTEIVTPGGKTTLTGEPLTQLKAFAYILRNEHNDQIIQNIEGGILKEISVGLSVKSCKCSICNGPMSGWWGECTEGHQKGADYDGERCYGILDGAVDAYEFSFVAVPAQRGAGVTKGAKNAAAAVELLLETDPKLCPPEHAGRLQSWLDGHRMICSEREEREKILSENQKFMKKENDEDGNTV